MILDNDARTAPQLRTITEISSNNAANESLGQLVVLG